MERLLVEGEGNELIVAGELLEVGDRDVEFEIPEPAPHFVEADELDVDRGRRMLPGEQAIDESGDRHAHRHRGNPQVAVELAAHDADFLDHRLAIGDDPLRPLQYPPALVGESLESPVTQDERHADLVFEMLDGAREGGLRHVAPGRGSTEVPFLLQRDQVLKLPQKHGGMSASTDDGVRMRSG